MHVHLHAAVLPQVKCGVLVYALGLARRHAGESHGQRLLVGFGELWLCGVLVTSDAWRQHVVDGSLVVVFLNVDGCCRYCSAASYGVVKCLLVYSPLSPY